MKTKICLRKYALTLFLAIVIGGSSAAQQYPSRCFNESQLLRMPQTTIKDIMEFMNNEAWHLAENDYNTAILTNYFYYPIDYNMVRWQRRAYGNETIYLFYSPGKYNIAVYHPLENCYNTLSLEFSQYQGLSTVEANYVATAYNLAGFTVEFREYSNYHSGHKYAILIYHTQQISAAIQVAKEKQLTLEKEAQEKEERYQKIISEAEEHFNNKDFEDAKVKFQKAFTLKEERWIEQKMKNCDQAICDQLLVNSDVLITQGKYEEAIILLNDVVKCHPKRSVVDEKIAEANRKIMEREFKRKMDSAQFHYETRDFNKALQVYQNALTINSNSVEAREKIEETQKILSILTRRETENFSYQITNPQNLQQFKVGISESITPIIRQNKHGQISFKFQIQFDTAGRNLSTFQPASTNSSSMTSILNDLKEHPALKPSVMYGYYFRSNHSLSVDANWKTSTLQFYSRASGIQAMVKCPKTCKVFEDYIKRQPYKYGLYVFDSKDITLNGQPYSEVYLTRYKMRGGPSCMFYSMLYPGLGTYMVSKESTRAVVTSLWYTVFGGLAIQQFSKSTNRNDEFYFSAQICLSITGAIYLYDVIWTLNRGVQNKRKARPLINTLKKGLFLCTRNLVI